MNNIVYNKCSSQNLIEYYKIYHKTYSKYCNNFDLKEINHYHKNSLRRILIHNINKNSGSKIIYDFLNDNLEDIIKSKSDDLLVINRKFNKLLSDNHFKYDSKISYSEEGYKKSRSIYLLNVLKRLFNYKKLSTENKKRIFSSIDNKVCAYCSRNYIYQIDEFGHNMGVNLDHYFSQKDYPILALSFHNLIPSCNTCNSVFKNKIEFDNTFFHPAEDGIENLKFTISLKDKNNLTPEYFLDEKNFEIKYRPNFSIVNFDKFKYDKIKKNIETFGLNVIYNHHKDIIQKMLIDYYIYSENQLVSEINKIFPRLDIKSPILGVAISKNDSILEPFGKLKSDIYNTLIERKLDKTNIKEVFK